MSQLSSRLVLLQLNNIAHVVSPDMFFEMRFLTGFVRTETTSVRSFPSVRADMSVKVLLGGRAVFTQMTSEWFLASVFQKVCVEPLFGDVATVAHVASEGLVTRVFQHMGLHVVRPAHDRTV